MWRNRHSCSESAIFTPAKTQRILHWFPDEQFFCYQCTSLLKCGSMVRSIYLALSQTDWATSEHTGVLGPPLATCSHWTSLLLFLESELEFEYTHLWVTELLSSFLNSISSLFIWFYDRQAWLARKSISISHGTFKIIPKVRFLRLPILCSR